MTLRVILLVLGTAVAVITAWLVPRLTTPPDRMNLALDLIAEGRAVDATYLLEDPAWRGIANYRAGRYRRALGDFFLNENVLTLYNMGNAYAQLHEWSGARAAYEKVLLLDPGHGDARHNLEIILAAEAYDKALADAERDQRDLGRWEDGNREDANAGQDAGGEVVEDADVTEGAARPTDTPVDKGGTTDIPGTPGELQQSADAEGGPSALADESTLSPSDLQGAGAALIRRESAQAAELLLRQIEDDPARVLAARLRAIDRLRHGDERK